MAAALLCLSPPSIGCWMDQCGAISQSSVVFTLLCAPIIVLYHHHHHYRGSVDGDRWVCYPQGRSEIIEIRRKRCVPPLYIIFFLLNFLKIRCIAERFESKCSGGECSESPKSALVVVREAILIMCSVEEEEDMDEEKEEEEMERRTSA